MCTYIRLFNKIGKSEIYIQALRSDDIGNSNTKKKEIKLLKTF